MSSARPSFLSRAVRWALLSIHRLQGWRITGQAPAVEKFILVGAPHSSNWDFITFLGATHQLGIEPSFVGKHSLFRWPMRRFMLDMGGIPVDRSRRAGFVDQLVAEFGRRRRLALVIAPEGSRGSEGHWRSGFYHVAIGAGVPIVPAWIDRRRKIGAIGEPIQPSGEYHADLERIASFYRRMDPGNPRFAMIGNEPDAKAALSNGHSNGLGDTQ